MRPHLSQMIRTLRTYFALLLAFAAACPAAIAADEVPPAVAAARAQAEKFAEDGYTFREDHWESLVSPKKGKGIRIQLFKGHEYRICVAAEPGSGAKIVSHVLGAEGKPIEDENEALEEGTAVNIRVSPEKTGVHIILVRQDGDEEVQCAMVIGYR